MRYRESYRWMNVALSAAALAVATAAPASAQQMFGALSNFDVFNDTGQETHGFEIELDGLTSADVVYTFGAPYERYGDPKTVDFPGGVYVRYESAYDVQNGVFLQATPVAPNPVTPTDGHACFDGGSPGYLSSGCEHFGVATNGNPTKTVYRWLVADPANPGALQPAGTKVSIPAPVYNVSPPPPASPSPQPVVAAVIAAPEPDAYEFGDALWVKVYKTESPDPANLDHLVTDDPAVPQDPAEVETEWFLLQAEVSKVIANSELANEAQIADGTESVTRRYEIFAYAGYYDPETHEAFPVSDTNPAPADIGNYLGAQMAAINVAAPQPPPPPALVMAAANLPAGEVGVAYGASLVSGGVPPYAAAVTAGAIPAGLSFDGSTGTLSGLPSAGSATPVQFSMTITDQAGQTASASFSAPISAPVRITTSTLPNGARKKSYRAALAAADGSVPYAWRIAGGSLPAGLTLDTATGVISGTPTIRGSSTFTAPVNDSLGGQAQKAFIIKVK